MDHDWQVRMGDICENFKAILREHDDDGIGDSARLYDRIDRAFNLFSCGEDGYVITTMNGALTKARDALTKNREENFNEIRRDMTGWQGEAANGFFTYVNQLDDGLNIMVDRIDTMQMIVRAHERLVQRMRADVLDLVRKTLAGIEAAETDGWEVGLTVVGAVAAFAAGVVGSVGGLPAWAVLGVIATNMAAAAPGAVVAVDGADDELGVMVRFVDSAEGLLHVIDIERLRIEKAFRELTASVTDANLVEVRPDRPTVVTAPDFRPASFGMQEDVQSGHATPTNTTDLVPEPKKHADGQFDRTRTKDGKERDRYQEQGSA
ncbi:hypothetical protein [Actinophytocola oryzae]|uniref:Uncharacterized protein n=1 Tax=Actinophytocola oryzae TaxID=502181 RepID=A0A4R7VW84_9PSEU|nr:hypothetical protein [Actinophytocola oryzae]TDV53739.1 hypothetical protein CLV71_104207 [Actinophytocola oryzae]